MINYRGFGNKKLDVAKLNNNKPGENEKDGEMDKKNAVRIFNGANLKFL